jgi:ABC-type proline/glycine betaine transport system permease subunit
LRKTGRSEQLRDRLLARSGRVIRGPPQVVEPGRNDAFIDLVAVDFLVQNVKTETMDALHSYYGDNSCVVEHAWTGTVPGEFLGVPIIATAPIIVLQFKYGRTSIVIISMLVSIFPVFSNTLAGLASTDRNQLDLFRLNHSGRLKTLFKLRFPAAMPNIAAGLRISAGMSVIGATVGEFLVGQGGARGGLGIAIIVSQAQLKTALLFAEAGAATLLGVTVFVATNAITNRALRNWHESALREEE